MKTVKTFFAATAAVATFASAALAAVQFNVGTGTGFVGKGDVQLVSGWNNAALQSLAGTIAFRYNATQVEQFTWECTNSKNEKIQERNTTTTVSTRGVVSHIARERNQITGFNLTGWADSGMTQTISTEGTAVNFCPGDPGADNDPWSLSSPAGEPVVTVIGGGLQVMGSGFGWTSIQ